MRLKDIAEVRTGLVLSRKEAKTQLDKVRSYKVLTLKSFNDDGTLNKDELDEFNSSEELKKQYLTQKGDVIIRLSSPNTAIHIDNNNTGYVIPSLFCVIRLREKHILPEFLTLYLNSSIVKKEIARHQIGSTISVIKTGFIKGLKIKDISKEKQKLLIMINKLYIKEKGLLNDIIKQKEILYKTIVEKTINNRRS